RLVTEAPVGVIHGIRQIERLEERAQVTRDLVLGAEVHLGRAREVHRLRRESAAILLLAEGYELLRLPLHRDPRLQLVGLIETDQIRRVTETGKRELIRYRTIVVEVRVGVCIRP